MSKIQNYLKIKVILAAILSFIIFIPAANADLKNPQISQEIYDKLQKEGVPTFIAYNSTWCKHCRKQDISLYSLRDQYKGKAAIYSMNWDQRKKYNIEYPSSRTTILFIHKNEIYDELAGETSVSKIKEFIDDNLQDL